MYSKTSNFEKIVRDFCKIWLGSHQVIYNHRPKFLNGLELDLFYPKLRFAIEVDGFTHYDASLKQQELDRKKNGICRRLGIQIVRIHYPQELLKPKLIKRIEWITKTKLRNSDINQSLIYRIVNYKPKKIFGLGKKVEQQNYYYRQKKKNEEYKKIQQKEIDFANYKRQYKLGLAPEEKPFIFGKGIVSKHIKRKRSKKKKFKFV